MKKLSVKKTIINAACFVSAALLPSMVISSANTVNFTAAPPFVATSVGKPNVVIALDISGSMKAVAYRDTAAGGWSRSTTIHDDFNPAARYYGYFESDAKYAYATSAAKRFFYKDASGKWDGNFMNWLTMRRMDVVRKVLVGGKVRDRNGEVIDGETWYVVEGQNEPYDHTFRKSYSSSSSVSEFGDDVEILISDGRISLNNAANTKVQALSDKVEIGQVSINRSTNVADEDLNSESNFLFVPFTNTYTNPVVVATGLSYNGGDPTHSRAFMDLVNYPGGFFVRLEEWAYRDVNHTTEEVTYIVSEATSGTPNKIKVAGREFDVQANVVTTSSTIVGSSGYINQSLSSPGYTPVVFSGVSSYNNDRPVIARTTNITSSGFNVGLQNEEALNTGAGHPAAEDIHWIAFEPLAGVSDYPADGIGPPIEIGDSGGNNVDHNFRSFSFDSGSSFFDETPILAISAQTVNGSDPAHPRYNNLSSTGFRLIAEEEQSKDSEISHADERVGYLAVEYLTGFKIQIGETEEPTGVVQQNAGSLRFGMAVYNYDHTRNPTSVYTGNKVHGGTFRPCYPDIRLDEDARTNFDICLDTHVKSPIENTIDVIEDHPLIWGSTPIAETLYDIKGYFEQRNHGKNGHTQWYDNGTENNTGTAIGDGEPQRRNSYNISNDWDPFYYEEFGAKLPCAKSFVLHFNDGEPYTDFDGASSLHPTITGDGDGDTGSQRMLDDVAIELRQNDCRSDLAGHQEIVSYYVYAALGESSSSVNTNEVREAAANGGFLDTDNDHNPDVAHPSNFGNYINAGNCTVNEWDQNADCNPDTFYFANDGAQLVTELNAAFESIATRAATGGASSVIAASRSGEGSVVNAIFRPFVSSGADEVTWIGDVHALMIDSSGNIRQDDGDQTLEEPSADPYLDLCTNDTENIVRAKKSNTLASRPTPAQFDACTEAVFPLDLFEIEYLWSGLNWLSDLTDDEVTDQRAFTSSAGGRYIISGIDTDGDGLVQNSEQVDFLEGSFPEEYAGLIGDTVSEAEDIITFIRGKDVPGYRSRQLDGKTMRLGDVIYSTPTIVGRPAENLDLLYSGTSYRKFFDRYRNRRQMVYAGGNDGMLHAFNGGWYNSETKKFTGAHGSDPGSTTQYDLGAEVWAYAPYNTLRHLEYLTNPTYGTASSDHVYFVDLKPRIFDAKVFANDTDHPDGWGTVLVTGMRLGGGAVSVDADLDSSDTDNRTLRSSYAIFDITNPDVPPKLLLEYTHPNLGFTTSVPTVITRGTDNEGSGDWYLAIGSGADTTADGFEYVKSTQNARVFLLDLKKVVAGSANVLETSFGTAGIATLGDANSFISDLVSVDFGLDNFTTDALYFGTVSGDETGWAGKAYRMKVQSNTGATQDTIGSWTPQVLIDAGKPITAPISVSTDSLRNRWLYFGTGRYFTAADNLLADTNNYYGLKEPRNTSGTYTYAAVNTSKLVDVTSVKVKVDTGELTPVPSVSPALGTGASVSDLERRMRQYTDASQLLSGWSRDFQAGERNFGSATLLGGTLSYTTFLPVFDDCSIGGSAALYVVNSLTGTAGKDSIIAQTDDDYVDYIIDLGSSPATTPSLHKGEGYTTDNKTKAIVQTANGEIITVDQDNKESVRDGEASWRQLQ